MKKERKIKEEEIQHNSIKISNKKQSFKKMKKN